MGPTKSRCSPFTSHSLPIIFARCVFLHCYIVDSIATEKSMIPLPFSHGLYTSRRKLKTTIPRFDHRYHPSQFNEWGVGSRGRDDGKQLEHHDYHERWKRVKSAVVRDTRSVMSDRWGDCTNFNFFVSCFSWIARGTLKVRLKDGFTNLLYAYC